jgi:2-polyprenyl-3-methyl-5-hydroxy-6-metoxy-1,4-benzoquinol methylase
MKEYLTVSARTRAHLEATRSRFDHAAIDRKKWKRRNAYYYRQLHDYLGFLVPAGYRVLELGSGDGDLLATLRPSRGLGIDLSGAFVHEARAAHPDLEFREDAAEAFDSDEAFDYVVMTDLLGHVEDVQKVFENLRRMVRPETRVVLAYYNYLWEPLLNLGDRLGMRMRQGTQNWLSQDDLENLLRMTGFETIKRTKKILFPIGIPLVSWFLNKVVANLPGINHLCLAEFLVARPMTPRQYPPNAPAPSVSLIVACKDEKGNIDELVRRTPQFPGALEMVFVDGHSKDGTQEEILRLQALFPEKNIRLFDQGATKGKGPAVHLGMREAKGDILIILDADISVAPEDTPKFYHQLVNGNGEFINGSRLVYPMEAKAMRFLNIWGNKFFSLAFTYLLGQRLKDTLCGTKALHKTDYDKIVANRSYFGDFDPFGDFDLLFGAAKLNMRILEMPVRYYERTYGEIKIERFKHGTMLLGMCAIALKKLKFV